MSACGWHGCDWEQCPECTVYRATDRELAMLRDQQATLTQLLREETEAAERNREAYARKAAEVDQLRAQVAQLQVELLRRCAVVKLRPEVEAALDGLAHLRSVTDWRESPRPQLLALVELGVRLGVARLFECGVSAVEDGTVADILQAQPRETHEA